MTKTKKPQTVPTMNTTQEVQVTSAPGSGEGQSGTNVELSHPTDATAESHVSNLNPTFRPHSKIARLVALLGEGSGASLEDMTETTGWQAHSVRAALTGLRKRGLVITRSMDGTMPLWSVRQSGQ